MNWCYDCIFQGVWKKRIGNAIILISKNKISKNIKISLNKFCGYVCAFCGFICLKVINFIHDFMALNLRETKRQTRVTIFLYWNYARVEPIFYNCFHQRITYVVTHWFRFIILGNRVVMTLKKTRSKQMQRFCHFLQCCHPLQE